MIEIATTAPLCIKSVVKQFDGPQGKVDAVRGVDFQLTAGKFAVIYGASGCGKTTLLLVVGGLLAPTSGQVLVNQTNPYQLSSNQRAAWRAANVGFVFQQIHLIPYLSVLDNVLVPGMAVGGDDGQQQAVSTSSKRAVDLLDQFRLSHRLQHLPSELSIGEQQRVGLARAVFNRPPVLLADEPTGNLDEENTEIVLKFFQEFARGGGNVMMVTHDPQARGAASHCVEMRDGLFVK